MKVLQYQSPDLSLLWGDLKRAVHECNAVKKSGPKSLHGNVRAEKIIQKTITSTSLLLKVVLQATESQGALSFSQDCNCDYKDVQILINLFKAYAKFTCNKRKQTKTSNIKPAVLKPAWPRHQNNSHLQILSIFINSNNKKNELKRI